MVVVHMLTGVLLLGAAAIASAAHGPNNVTSFAIVGINESIVYAGTSDRGVLKSWDGAVSWSPTGLTSSPVTALAIDPVTPDILYAGTADRGVLKSTNGGATWTATGLGGVRRGPGDRPRHSRQGLFGCRWHGCLQERERRRRLEPDQSRE